MSLTKDNVNSLIQDSLHNLLFLETINPNLSTIYFALSKEDVVNGFVDYKKSNKFSHKLVHTNLQSLRKFIEDNFVDSGSFSYCVVNELSGNIDSSVINERGTVSLKLPFSFTLTNKTIKPLFT